MKSFDGKWSGDRSISEDLHLRGLAEGSLTVVAPAVLQLDGTVVGDLVIEQGATAFVSGAVNGSVINRGTVEVAGVVQGQVIDDDGGTSRLLPQSVVGGVRQT